MLRVAICDDESVIAHQIENNVYKTCIREGIKVDTEVYYSGNDLEEAILTGQNFDLIYLDIQMENGDGISTAKNIRKMDENVLLIFVSSYDRYLMELFQLDVFCFIKKPIDSDSFSQKFLEANEKICNKSAFFVFKYKNREYKILCKDIVYFESKGRQVNIFVKNGDVHIFNEKLSEVEKRLEHGKISFLRIHQSYLVNYLLIKSRSKADIILVNGTRLPISEEKQKEFSREYGKLLRGEVNV